MKPIILLILLALPCLALTPKERELVNGLSKINTELRANNAAQEAQIEKDATDAQFAATKIDDLSAKLKESRELEETQRIDLLAEQIKVKAIESERDAALKERDAAKADAAKQKIAAHRNAVERDICLVAAAIAVTVLVMTCAGKIIAWAIKIYPPCAPFAALIEIGLAIGTFAATYGAGRGVLAIIYSHL